MSVTPTPTLPPPPGGNRPTPAPATADSPQGPKAEATLLGRTTPARMRSLQVIAFAVATLAGILLSFDAAYRVSTIDDAERAAELVASTQDLRAAFGRADGASVGAFLAGGIEQPDEREAYRVATGEAASALTRTGRAANSDEAVALADELQRQLPVYTGLVETARADNRQELALGAAYLRSASELVRTDIGERTDALNLEGDRIYRGSVDDILSGLGLISMAAILAMVAALAFIQYRMSAWTNRTLNIGLVAASGILLVGLAVIAGQSKAAATQTADATRAYDRLSALSALRADAYDQQASSTFALVDRGARERFNAEAATSSQNLAVRADVLGLDAAMMTAWNDYLDLSTSVTALDASGDYAGARTAAFDKPARFAAFDDLVTSEVAIADAELTNGLDRSRWAYVLLQFVGIPLGLLVGATAGWGIQKRIADYR